MPGNGAIIVQDFGVLQLDDLLCLSMTCNQQDLCIILEYLLRALLLLSIATWQKVGVVAATTTSNGPCGRQFGAYGILSAYYFLLDSWVVSHYAMLYIFTSVSPSCNDYDPVSTKRRSRTVTRRDFVAITRLDAVSLLLYTCGCNDMM